MKQFISGLLLAAFAIALYACTTPESGGSGGTGGGGKTVLFKVNGRPVTAEEFFRDRQARDAVQQYVIFESIKDAARKAGVKPDQKELDERTAEMKRMMEQQGQTWEDFLKTQNMTEPEFLEQQQTYSLIEALVEKKTPVSEEEMKTVWETDKEALINEYAGTNHLPDSEKAKLTYEDVKELARERVIMNKRMMVQGEVMGDVILDAKLELVAIPNDAKAKEVAERIMGPMREQAEQQKKMAEEAKKAEEGAAGGTPTEDDADAEGEPAGDAEAAAGDEPAAEGEAGE